VTLLDQFNAITLEEIERLVEQGKEENLHLEFKTVEKPDLSRPEDRQKLAICMSGFANSDGGIVIWGVKTDRKDGADRAVAPAPMIKPLRVFFTRLHEITGDATSPISEGVCHRILEAGEDIGFVKTLVPQSDRVYRAEFGLKKYFKRSGSSFREMEHFDLEDIFGRRQRPALDLTAEPMEGLGDERERVAFMLENTGRAIAKYVGFLAWFENAEIANVSGGSIKDVTNMNDGRPTVSYEESIGVVHPVPIRKRVGWVAFKRSEKDKPVLVQVTWYCENMLPREATFELSAAQAAIKF
jgi:hypothetical protein